MRNPLSVQPILTISYTLADPENGGTEAVNLLRCKFWEIPIGFKDGEIIEEAVPFTFEQFDITSCLGDDYEGGSDVNGLLACAEAV